LLIIEPRWDDERGTPYFSTGKSSQELDYEITVPAAIRASAETGMKL